jgi:glycolate oxidase subunit GlcD
MPEQRDPVVENLRAIVGRDHVLSAPDELLVYECDGLPHHKHLPRAVVFPSTTEETADVMRVLGQAGVSFTPRGAGTGLSGGALALDRGVVVELARMRKILKIDEATRIAVVQPGVVNAHVSRAVAHLGLHYVPDPSSQPTCTIGGNIAENAGGIHCLKYGTTTDHVLALRVVLAGGEIVDLGGAGTEAGGYDLAGVFVGSEGTFGIATEAILRLVPIPPAVRTMLAEFPEVNDASHAVSAIIAAGVMPAGLEMMDREIIRAVEASVFAAGLSLDIGAALLIELDGIEAGIDDEADRVKSICLQYGARTCRLAQDENERKKLWAARKNAFGAVSRISPDSMIQDAVVPRSRLPEVLDAAYRIAAKYQLLIANVFHAGDGNLHPLICFDSRSADQVHRVKEAGRELMETCVRAGGSITGEHGVGFDKRELLPLIFSEADMDTMLRVRAAFDPSGLCNPGKIIPTLRGCGEARAQTKSKVQSPMSKVPSSAVASVAGILEAGALPGPQATRLHDSLDPSLADTDTHHLLPSNGNKAPRLARPFDPDDAADQLSLIVGHSNIIQSLLPSSFPSALTVVPSSIEDVCDVMKLASSSGWTVVPAGAATWLDAGNSLKQVNIVISTRKLNRIVEHEPADLIAIAEAGTTLHNLNDTLVKNGQWLAIDPPDEADRVTVGGVVATGLGGAQQFSYGAPRRHVIGMKVVLADGSLIKVGGRVVKNVAGYDLCKLFTGSYGTLGVIVEVNFKLRPVPFETITIVVTGERGGLTQAARKVIESRLFPVAVELLSPGVAAEAGLPPEKEHVLLIKFAGSVSGVAQQTSEAIALMDATNGGLRARILSDDVPVWRSLASLPLRFSEELMWRVGLRPADLEAFLAKLVVRDDFPTSDRSSGLMWHAGLGDGRVRVVDNSEQTEDKTISRLEALRTEAQKLGSALIIESAQADLRNRIGAWGPPGSSTGLMQRIKQQLDPDGILSPGRFCVAS